MTRAERKTARRELAAWLRGHGLAPVGAVWEHATAGTRDLDTLARYAAVCGGLLKRRADGRAMPAGLRDGMTLGGSLTVVGAPVVDPETGEVFVVVRGPDGTTRDMMFRALTPVTEQTPAAPPPVAKPSRKAPPWVQAAAADYRDARDAWIALRESCEPMASVSTVAGAAGSAVCPAQLSDDEFAAAYPRPAYRDYLRDHAARRRELV